MSFLHDCLGEAVTVKVLISKPHQIMLCALQCCSDIVSGVLLLMKREISGTVMMMMMTD